MIDFNNPYRNPIESMVMPNQASVDKMFRNMDEVLALITEGLDLDLLEINKAYIQQCLSYESIQQDGRDINKYMAVLSND